MRTTFIALAIFAQTAAAHVGHAQTATLSGMDSTFLKNNLQLLAGALNIDAHKALEVQSRAYPNPQFTAEVNMLDPQSGQWFRVGSGGQKAFAIEQTIILSGRRKVEIELARLNTQQAALELEEVLRGLKMRLHMAAYSLYADNGVMTKLNAQLALLDTLIDHYMVQVAKGNVSAKEVVRLKSVYLKLNSEKTDVSRDMEEQRKAISILLRGSTFNTPEFPEHSWQRFAHLPLLDSLMEIAPTMRAEWKLAALQQQQAAENLRLQKSLAIPDVTAGSSYDQRGGAFNNQVNMTLGMPLPLWNRNKGNIRAAQAETQMAALNSEQRHNEIKAEITEAWRNMMQSIQEYQKTTALYTSDFDAVYKGITDNFRKRNISIIEFVDFFESYSESIAQLQKTRKQLALAAEILNHAVGADIYQQR